LRAPTKVEEKQSASIKSAPAAAAAASSGDADHDDAYFDDEFDAPDDA